KTANPMLYRLLKEYSQKMRNVPSEAEKLLRNAFCGKNMGGYKFRRQHIIGAYIMDFICLKSNLIVEVVGFIHILPANQKEDVDPTSWLEKEGYRVLRFTNDEVLNDLAGVLNSIYKVLKAPPSGAGGAAGKILMATVKGDVHD